MSQLIISNITEKLRAIITNGINKEDNSDNDYYAVIDSCIQQLNENCYMKIEAVLNKIWEDLNVGAWCDVSKLKRRLYAFSSLIKIYLILSKSQDINSLKDALSAADNGLLLGFGFYNELCETAKLLSTAIYEVTMENDPHLSTLLQSVTLDIIDSDDVWNEQNKIVSVPINETDCPSLEDFYRNNLKLHRPVKLMNCITHWAALNKWKDLSYLFKIAGPRKVPIEIGSSYIEEEWGMNFETIQSFIIKHIINKSDKIGYLAQHSLFNQVPELKEDIKIPEYCCLSESGEIVEESDVDINAWFGPPGTVSPLHYDQKHNLLAQVIGRKRVILYPPEKSENLYPFEGKMMFNTAEINPEEPDYIKFPKFQNLKATECRLYPGDILYIPPKWWHHVRAMDISFSVSFWWK